MRGAKTIQQGRWEIYQFVTWRTDKGSGSYGAADTKTEFEYGATNHFNVAFAVETLSIDTSGLTIGGYLPGPRNYTLRPSGVEAEVKYSFLQPALSAVGLSMTYSLEYAWLDPHSGQDKQKNSGELGLQVQKYFTEGQFVAMANAGLESTYADRGATANLPR